MVYSTTVVILQCFYNESCSKENVDDLGFPEDTRQTIGVVCPTCAAIKSLKGNDRHMWAI
jgi:hypothetical protein